MQSRTFTSAALQPLDPPMFNISDDATGIRVITSPGRRGWINMWWCKWNVSLWLALSPCCSTLSKNDDPWLIISERGPHRGKGHCSVSGFYIKDGCRRGACRRWRRRKRVGWLQLWPLKSSPQVFFCCILFILRRPNSAASSEVMRDKRTAAGHNSVEASGVGRDPAHRSSASVITSSNRSR